MFQATRSAPLAPAIATLLLLTCCPTSLLSQQATTNEARTTDRTPSAVKYSGYLSSLDGRPLTGTQGVTFLVYEEATGGAPLWMETQNVHADKNGHYSVTLGSATAHGLPAEILTGSGARWIGVQPSGQPEQPRTLLFSLPYGGMRASPASQAIPLAQAQERPDPESGQKLPPTVHGNGIANFIPVWTAKDTIDESIISQSGGNIGVGTNTPATNLDVFSGLVGIHAPMAQFGSKGTTDSNSILTYNGTGTTEMFQTGCANCFVPGAQAGDGGMRVGPGKSLFLGDSSNPRLRLDSAGNAEQPRTANGMVKAMITYRRDGVFLWCFNSTLSGAAATKPPCGFTTDKTGIGDYIIDFGFQVDDRFFSIASAFDELSPTNRLSVGSDQLGSYHSLTANQLEVGTHFDDKFVDCNFILIVY
jgi:hypothetical protein